MIEHLIDSTFDHVLMFPESLEHYLRYGFEGFENYSDAEIIAEYRDYVSEDPNADIEIILTKD